MPAPVGSHQDYSSLFPPRHDAGAWGRWWTAWADIGRLAARLCPGEALYRPEWCGDHLIDVDPPDWPERGAP